MPGGYVRFIREAVSLAPNGETKMTTYQIISREYADRRVAIMMAQAHIPAYTAKIEAARAEAAAYFEAHKEILLKGEAR